jgi:hypothetical protein
LVDVVFSHRYDEGANSNVALEDGVEMPLEFEKICSEPFKDQFSSC